MTDIRVTQIPTEVVTSIVSTPVARVTQLVMEVITSAAVTGTATLRRVTFSINFT